MIVNGYGLSETHFGGYAEKARVKGEWLVKLPAALTPRGGHGDRHRGLYRDAVRDGARAPRRDAAAGPALVTGAAGGVGSTAISLLAAKGWKVIASTGRASEADYLKSLGAAEIIDRATLSAPGKPLGKELWAAAVDSVGSTTLANVLAQTRYGGAVAACGLAGGMDLPTTVRALYPAQRRLAWRGQRAASDAGSTRGLAAPRGRTRPRQARGHHPYDPVRRGVRGGPPDPQGRDPRPDGGDDRVMDQLAGLSRRPR